METVEIFDTKLLIDGKVDRTTILNVIEYPQCLEKGIEIFLPSNTDYLRSIDIAKKLLEIGKPVPAIDILIATICLNKNFTLVTEDQKHFLFIKEVEPEFKLKVEE